MIKLNKRGFTLIELLVVIAIIGILASIVLVSLNDARNKGKDVAIKSALSEARSQAEMFYDENSMSYLSFCNTVHTSQGFGNATTGIEKNITDNGGTVVCHDNANAWAAYATLSDDTMSTRSYWCVDSTGVSAATSAVATTGGVCQ